MLTKTAPLLLLLLTPLTVLGQSCSGSIRCPGGDSNLSSRLVNANTSGGGFSIESIDIQRRYRDGEQIACAKFSNGGICAFLEGTGDGLTGDKIKELAGRIPALGCASCGNVPISLASGQDGREGILKFDFVGRTCLEGRDVALC